MTDTFIRENALKQLSAPATEEALKGFVEWLDEMHGQESSIDGLPQLLITRSIIAIGYYLTDHTSLSLPARQNILKTIKAASEYVIYPDANSFEKYFTCATNSYPFGAGEGCYSVKQLVKNEAHPCAIGSGCMSRAGSILLNGIDHTIAFQVIVADLIPWLKNSHDPVLDIECG